MPPLAWMFWAISFWVSETGWASQMALVVKNLPANAGDIGDIQSLGLEDLLEQGMATHSSTLAWRTPWTEEPGELQSIGLQSQTRLSDWAHMQDTTCHHVLLQRSVTRLKGQTWSTACFCKQSFTGAQPGLFTYILSTAPFMQQRPSWVAVTETMRPLKPKILTVSSL